MKRKAYAFCFLGHDGADEYCSPRIIDAHMFPLGQEIPCLCEQGHWVLAAYADVTSALFPDATKEPT